MRMTEVAGKVPPISLYNYSGSWEHDGESPRSSLHHLRPPPRERCPRVPLPCITRDVFFDPAVALVPHRCPGGSFQECLAFLDAP